MVYHLDESNNLLVVLIRVVLVLIALLQLFKIQRCPFIVDSITAHSSLLV